MTDIINSTDATFEQEVVQSDKLVLVDFWAPWCGPCKAIAPILDGLAKDYDGKAQIVKVNIDDSKAIASQYGIRSIPTLFVFKDGEKVDTLVGLQNKAQLSAILDKHLVTKG